MIKILGVTQIVRVPRELQPDRSTRDACWCLVIWGNDDQSRRVVKSVQTSHRLSPLLSRAPWPVVWFQTTIKRAIRVFGGLRALDDGDCYTLRILSQCILRENVVTGLQETWDDGAGAWVRA